MNKMYEYEFNVFKYGEDWICEFPDLRGCTGVGDTEAEAVEDGLVAKELWLADYFEEHGTYPEPSDVRSREYSGNFMVRGTKSLHRELSIVAKNEGVSLNALCCQILSVAVGMKNAMATFSFSATSSNAKQEKYEPGWSDQLPSSEKIISINAS